MRRITAWLLALAAPLFVAAGPAPSVPSDVAELALDLVACARADGLIGAPPPGGVSPVTLIDFRLPSTEKRLWVIDEASGEVLFHERVAHGKNTGEDEATSFSNEPGSLATSLGLFRTAETYTGRHGRSLRLDGLEPGFNDHARERAIVVHGADYVSDRFVEQVGRLGRSWGCPALDAEVSDAVIDRIQGGTPLLAFADDADWQSGSELLQCARERSRH